MGKSKLLRIYLRLPHEHKYLETDFSSETWSVVEMYWHYLYYIKNYQTGKITQVNITVSDIANTKCYKVVGFKDAYLLFDFKTYFLLNKFDKKKMQLETVHKAMLGVAEKEDWDLEPLFKAYTHCLKNNLEYKFFIQRPKSSPNRKHRIGFWCNWDIDIFELYWVLYDKKNNEIKRERFIKESPDIGEFIYYVNWKWLDNSTVLLEGNHRYGRNKTWKLKVL